VTWNNSRGGSGTATGTTSWNANNIPLQNGVNVITVTAYDAANNPGSDTLTVTNLTRTIAVAGNLVFGNVYVGGSSNAIMTITNSGNSTLTVSSITTRLVFRKLVRHNSSQHFPKRIGYVYHFGHRWQGVLVNSDATAGGNEQRIGCNLPVLLQQAKVTSWFCPGR
jgi:hypothetical protein